MIKKYSKIFKALHFVGDLILLNLAIYLAIMTRFSDDFPFWLKDKYVVLLFVFNFVWVISANVLNIYEMYRVVRFSNVVWNLIKTVTLHLLLMAIFIVMLKWYYFSREFLFYSYCYFGLLLVVFRVGFLVFVQRMRSKGMNTRNAVIIGAGAAGRETRELLLDHPEYGFKFLGYFDDMPPEGEDATPFLGSIDNLEEYARHHTIEEMFCAIPLAETEKIRKLIRFADNNMIRFKIIPDFSGFYHRRVTLEFYEEVPVLLRRSEPLENAFNSFIKRAFDIVFSSFVILFLLSWLSPILAILIRLGSKGPVFFTQKRSGKVNQEFWCWKFRTMEVNTDADAVGATKNDPRITRIGKFLRHTSLDELPQFYNVLLGNMSVVGPRPHMLKHTEEYAKIVDRFMVRHFVTPGITGLAQVRGYRGEVKDSELMYRRVRTDVWYIENWSFLLDIQIIFKTIQLGFKGDKMAF
ncbi:MAG: undecaprenyl-phosphate glucose phosphotransferase [Flavobacteriales bacterium]|nr:undecaprenyl-phosphate glucose phosphotransferase [Flavobacteriales bacterium]